jgi:hypothetical protein
MPRRCPYCHQELSFRQYSPHVARHLQIRADGQQQEYMTLPPEQRFQGDLAGVPRAYRHEQCGGETSMPEEIIRTYLQDPWFYDPYTFCSGCGRHVHQRQLQWVENGQRLDHYFEELQAANPDRRPGIFTRRLPAWVAPLVGVAMLAFLLWWRFLR